MAEDPIARITEILEADEARIARERSKADEAKRQAREAVQKLAQDQNTWRQSVVPALQAAVAQTNRMLRERGRSEVNCQVNLDDVTLTVAVGRKQTAAIGATFKLQDGHVVARMHQVSIGGRHSLGAGLADRKVENYDGMAALADFIGRYVEMDAQIPLE